MLYYVLCILAYLALVRFLRYRRLSDLVKQYPEYHASKVAAENMSYRDAEKITSLMFHFDTPYVASLALQFALFKTYGIPTISAVLQSTGQLQVFLTISFLSFLIDESEQNPNRLVVSIPFKRMVHVLTCNDQQVVPKIR